MPFTIDPKKVREAQQRFLKHPDSMDEKDLNNSDYSTQEESTALKPDPYDGRKDMFGGSHTGSGTRDDSERDTAYDSGMDYGGFGSGRELPPPAPAPTGRHDSLTGRRGGTKETGLTVTGGEETGLVDETTYSRLEDEREKTDSLPPVLIRDRRNGYIGTVRGLGELKPESIPGGLTRWFTSMFTGVPFCRDRAGFRFMLKPDAWSDKGSRQVIMYGLVQEGFLYDGSKVVVHGRTSGSGSIHANRIDLITDDDALPTRVTIMHQMSALFVWLCTLALIALAYCAVQVGIMIFNGIMQNIVAIIVILIIVVWILSRFRRRRRRRWWWF